jgi:serine/threonine-protein kinase RsbW
MMSKRPEPGAAELAPVHLERRFRSGDLETRAALQDICGGLAAVGIGADDVATVELVLAEVLNNVSEHAYADGAGPVEVLIAARGPGLTCRVRDRGQPMPRGELPDPPYPPFLPADALPEGGFGWHIIRCLTSDLAMERREGWNELRMTIPLSDVDD